MQIGICAAYSFNTERIWYYEKKSFFVFDIDFNVIDNL